MTGPEGKHAAPKRIGGQSTLSRESGARDLPGRRSRLMALGLLLVGAVAAIAFGVIVLQAANAHEEGSGLSTGLTLVIVGPFWVTMSVLIAITGSLLIWKPESMGGYISGCLLGGLSILVGVVFAVRGLSTVPTARWFGFAWLVWGGLLLASLVSAQVSQWTVASRSGEPGVTQQS